MVDIYTNANIQYLQQGNIGWPRMNALVWDIKTKILGRDENQSYSLEVKGVTEV